MKKIFICLTMLAIGIFAGAMFQRINFNLNPFYIVIGIGWFLSFFILVADEGTF